VSIDNDPTLPCVAVPHGDRHRITVVADSLSGQVRHEHGLAGHRRLLESVLQPSAILDSLGGVGAGNERAVCEEDESPFVGLLQVEAA
jgi:hypothetical protein